MVAPLPWSDIALLCAALLAGGLVTGFLAGLLGIGGGGILVPVLYEAFTVVGVPNETRMHMVLGTSFAIIAPTAWRSFQSHRAKGAVDMEVVRRLAPAVLLGVIAGILLVSSVGSDGLKWIWIVSASLLGLKMALGREDWRLADHLPIHKGLEATAFAIGLISTLMSIGGGMFMVSLLTLFGYPLLTAVATSSAFGPVIAIPGMLGYIWAGWGMAGVPPLSLGYVSLAGAAIVVPASVFAAPFGVRAAHGLTRRKLEIAFAVFLWAVSLRLFVSLI